MTTPRREPDEPSAAHTRYRLADKSVWRVGYGAMQLAGDNVYGPPRDRDEAIAVLRAAVDAGVDHIDTAQYYGPGVVNELIREALHPYPDGLALVSKVAARRDDSGAVLPYDDPDQLPPAYTTTSRRWESSNSPRSTCACWTTPYPMPGSSTSSARW